MTDPQDSEKTWVQVRPTYPYRPGEGPDSVEYQWFPLSGNTKTMKAPLGQNVQVDVPARIRYRYYWGDRSSPWSDGGSLLWPGG